MCVTINKMTKGNIVFVIPVRINYTRTRQYVQSKCEITNWYFKGAMSRNCACSGTTSQLEKVGPTFSSFAGDRRSEFIALNLGHPRIVFAFSGFVT